MFQINKQNGFVRTILIIIIAILVLSYFGVDIKAIVDAPGTQKNLTYVWDGVSYVWINYLARPFNYLWYDIFVDKIWSEFLKTLDTIKAGGNPNPTGPSVTGLTR